MSKSTFLPSVSVIVPIFNGAADVPRLLEQITAQTYQTDQVEYLLVDNNSCDRTAEILQAALADYSGLPLKILQETAIQSSYAARNTGIRAASGEVLAFTDADCCPQVDWLEQLVQPFQNADIGLVIGEIRGLPGQTWLERYADQVDTLSQRYTLEHSFCPYGQTANLAVRSSVLKTVGLFRPYLTTGGDADLCWRIQRESDWQLAFAEDAIIQHRHRSNFAELRSQWRRYGRSNRYLHELYGVSLMPKPRLKYQAYLLSRWLLKEAPQNLLTMLKGQESWISLVRTPINVYCNWQRFQGQQTAQSLDTQAQFIDRL
ncbi:MAG: glycosyltransferase [Cyanobacteria bacterium P01_H01_bin.121]